MADGWDANLHFPLTLCFSNYPRVTSVADHTPDSTRTPDIFAIGEALIEFVRLDVKQDSLKNIKENHRPLYQQGYGGDTSNALIAAARQGACCGYITAVGNDIFGKDLLDLWSREKICTDYIKTTPENPTGVYFVQPHASGRQYTYARKGSAASQYQPDWLPLDAIAAAKALHASALSSAISQPMRDSVIVAFEQARAHNTLVSYDTNLRLNLWSLENAVAAIEKVLPLVDIVFPSDDEAQQISGRENADDLIDYFLEFGCKLVVLTRGDAGAVVASKQGRTTIPPAPSTPVDATAAGDSFAGSFLVHYLETGDTTFAGRCAAATAASTVSGLGALDPIPYRDSVLATVKTSG